MPPTIRYRVPLTCTNCGTLNDARSIDLHTSGLGSDPVDTSAVPGQGLELELADFVDAFLVLRMPREDELTFVAIELWGCGACNRLRAARLEFRRRTRFITELANVATCTLSKDALDGAHFVSRSIDEWAVQPGDDAVRIAELERRLT